MLLQLTWKARLLLFSWTEQLLKSDLLLQAWWPWLQHSPCLWLYHRLSRHSLFGFCQKWSFHWNAFLPSKQFRQCSDFGSQTPHDICGHGSHYMGSLPSPTSIALILHCSKRGWPPYLILNIRVTDFLIDFLRITLNVYSNKNRQYK